MLTAHGDEADDPAAPGLVADIGGTNVRFGLVDADGTVHAPAALKVADFPDIESAAAHYLGNAPEGPPPSRAAFAIACPVVGDTVEMTNHRWAFSIAAVRERLGLARLTVVNDFAAVALAVPHLGPDDLDPVGTPRDGEADPGAFPKVVIGPGTGLGMAGLVPVGGGLWQPVTSEGGHATMPAVDDRETHVIDRLRWTWEHVSAERVISGPGLVNLYTALCEIDGEKPASYKPGQVAGRALDGSDPFCVEALEMFCAMLGTVAGDLCLAFGARGGVYIAGGIVPKLGAYFALSPFRARFEAKGRFEDYLAAVPTAVVTAELPAFTGLAGLLRP